MATIKTTTGQITITDHNDALSISSYLQASKGTTQVYSVDEGETISQYNPDWNETATNPPQILTGFVYTGNSTTSIAGNSTLFKNIEWWYGGPTTTDGGTKITASGQGYTPTGVLDAFTLDLTNSQNVLKIKKNILNSVKPNETFYFIGDCLDTNTQLTTKVVTPITLTTTFKGASAKYVIITGNTTILKSSTTTPSITELTANYYANGATTDTNIKFRWSKYNSLGNPEYIVPTDARDMWRFYYYDSTESKKKEITTFTAGDWTLAKYVEISEKAVDEIDRFRVEVMVLGNGGAETTEIYEGTTSVTDLSDPYDCNILSSAGSTFKNNSGSTYLTPEVKKGSTILGELDGWHFGWSLWDQDGNQTAFISKTDDTPPASISRAISSNTEFTITLATAFSSVNVGNLIKLISTENEVSVVQVASVSGITISICQQEPFATFIDTSLETGKFSSGYAYLCESNNVYLTESGTSREISDNGTSYFLTSSALTYSDSGTTKTVAKDDYVVLHSASVGTINYVKILSVVTESGKYRYNIYTTLTDEYDINYLSTSLSVDEESVGIFKNGTAIHAIRASSGNWKYGNFVSLITNGVNESTEEEQNSLYVNSDDIDTKGTINISVFQADVGSIPDHTT